MNKPKLIITMTIKVMDNKELIVDHPFGEDAEKAAVTLLVATATAFKSTRRLKSYGIHLTDLFRDIAQVVEM